MFVNNFPAKVKFPSVAMSPQIVQVKCGSLLMAFGADFYYP